MSNARDIALLALDRKELPGWRTHAVPRRFASGPATAYDDPRDRALAEQIEVGVVKNLLQLQFLIEQIAGRPLSKVHPLLQKILAIAIFQLRYLNRVPESAAVNEGVEQTKRYGLAHARGFANAVLRKAVISARNPLPCGPDAQERARLEYSHPAELFQRLARLLGDEQALSICKHDNEQPPVVARLSPGRTLQDALAVGVQAQPHRQEGMVVLTDATKEDFARLAAEAIAQVQDATSAKVVVATKVGAGMSVLDRCCGMGTKTLQAWELARAAATIVAIDPSASRCRALQHMLAARQIQNVQVIQSSTFPYGNPDVRQQFDRVLVDVPCSNSGVLCRRPEARYTQSQDHLDQLQRIQVDLLRDAIRCVAPGGQVIYSTCSIWPEENQDLVALVLKDDVHLQRLHEETTLPFSSTSPADYHDGGYYAVIERATST